MFNESVKLIKQYQLKMFHTFVVSLNIVINVAWYKISQYLNTGRSKGVVYDKNGVTLTGSYNTHSTLILRASRPSKSL